MNKAEFLKVFRSEHAKLETLLQAVGSERLEVAGVSGSYSVKDILAHLTAYNRALVNWLNAAQAGQVYVDPVVDQPDLDTRNAAVYARNKDRRPAAVREAFHQTLAELEACIDALSDEELNDAERTAWFVEPRWQRKQALWQCIANDSYEHHQQHIPDIKRWLAEHGAEH
jgi:hypothetical protein